MPAASRTELWDAPIEIVYDVITDFESYPEFVDGCSSAKILEQNDSMARVEFGLNFIKKFHYILKLDSVKNEQLSWHFESGSIFKKNQGRWLLMPLDDCQTKITYELEVEIKGFAPKSLVSSLAEKNLPAMLESYHERCRNRALL